MRKARIELGEHVLVTGMGLVGQLVMRLAAGIRAETLIAVDLLDERLQKPKEGGATPAFNPQTVDLKAEIQKVTQERGLDVGAKSGTGIVLQHDAVQRRIDNE